MAGPVPPGSGDEKDAILQAIYGAYGGPGLPKLGATQPPPKPAPAPAAPKPKAAAPAAPKAAAPKAPSPKPTATPPTMAPQGGFTADELEAVAQWLAQRRQAEQGLAAPVSPALDLIPGSVQK